MSRQYIPEDINAEVLLTHFENKNLKVSFKGLHKRNVRNDIKKLSHTTNAEDGFEYDSLELVRDSLYNVLPEYLFHRIDRFENLRRNDDRFTEQIDKQKQEIERARNFFNPLDLGLLRLKCEVHQKAERYADGNIVLQHILTDNLTQEQKGNRFVRRALEFLPSCKYMRGNRTLLTLMLRKILFKENLEILVHNQKTEVTDSVPQYDCCVGDSLDHIYAGNKFDQQVLCYDISYWPETAPCEEFEKFLHDMDIFRNFIEAYFLSVESMLKFNIITDENQIILSNPLEPNYLGYNSNL